MNDIVWLLVCSLYTFYFWKVGDYFHWVLVIYFLGLGILGCIYLCYNLYLESITSDNPLDTALYGFLLFSVGGLILLLFAIIVWWTDYCLNQFMELGFDSFSQFLLTNLYCMSMVHMFGLSSTYQMSIHYFLFDVLYHKTNNLILNLGLIASLMVTFLFSFFIFYAVEKEYRGYSISRREANILHLTITVPFIWVAIYMVWYFWASLTIWGL